MVRVVRGVHGFLNRTEKKTNLNQAQTQREGCFERNDVFKLILKDKDIVGFVACCDEEDTHHRELGETWLKGVGKNLL